LLAKQKVVFYSDIFVGFFLSINIACFCDEKKFIRQGPLTTHMSEWRENASRLRSLEFPPLLLAKQVGILFLSEQKSRYVKCK